MPIQKLSAQNNGWTKKEASWFPEYYIGWIGIGNCGQKTLLYTDHDHVSHGSPICSTNLIQIGTKFQKRN